MADKIDLKRARKHHYSATQEPALVDIGDVAFLMVDGAGDPNTSDDYAEALGVLFKVAYTVKFREKAAGRDFVVAPLEGLWWAPDMDAFIAGDKDAWEWTAMIALPDSVPEAVVEGLVGALAAGEEPPPGIDRIRLERFAEGEAAQILHLGPYADEEPTIRRLHDFIDAEGLARRGRHHEIYLSDPRRTAPERLRTIIRQPVGPA
ncbi:MAG: GyrI-like domain-containing protein [Actinobacteria bacterium]|nr:GyrI-like domain-containing protein [Actinomycetota bacterium]